jgi:protocatechuate 3,4-dioxygenase beta subunit
MRVNSAVALHEVIEEVDEHHWCPRLDRRAAVRLLSMTALASAAGCGANGSPSTATGASGGTTASATGLTASATSVAQNGSVSLTAVVTPAAASGTITFYDGTIALGTATLSGGSATLTTSFSTTGTQTLTAAYAGNTTYAASTSASVSLTVTATTSTACSATLEGEEGPYFVDDSASGYLRSNILSNLDGTSTQTGIPLTLTVYVYDSEKSCAAMQGVQVDIWHCNASGIYSAESVEATVGQSWLRGYQMSDSSGKVTFNTIFPGWYSGRATHIHLRFRSTYDETDTSGSNTMQVFFDQTLVDTIDTTVSPYAAEGKNPTTNAIDNIYSSEEKGTTVVTLTGSVATGYTGAFSAYMPI